MGKEFWENKWKHHDTPWSFEGSNECAAWAMTRAHLPEGGSVFIPLCGDSSAVRFFYEQGAKVVGLEYIPEALNTLRKRDFSDLEFQIEQRGSFKTYQSDSLQLFEGDIFDINSEPKEETNASSSAFRNQFDLIYDRAAFVAIDPSLRERYAETLSSLLAPSGYLAIEIFSVGDYLPSSPPFPIDYLTLRKLFPKLSLLEHSVRTNRSKESTYADSSHQLYERHWFLFQDKKGT